LALKKEYDAIIEIVKMLVSKELIINLSEMENFLKYTILKIGF